MKNEKQPEMNYNLNRIFKHMNDNNQRMKLYINLFIYLFLFLLFIYVKTFFYLFWWKFFLLWGRISKTFDNFYSITHQKSCNTFCIPFSFTLYFFTILPKSFWLLLMEFLRALRKKCTHVRKKWTFKFALKPWTWKAFNAFL